MGNHQEPPIPLRPVQYRNAPKREGLPWDQIAADYEANGGTINPAVWPGQNGKVRIQGAKVGRYVHTWVEAVENDPPPVEKKPAPAPKRRRVVMTRTQRREVAKRYAAGESTNELAAAFGVSTKAVLNAVVANGGRLRTLKESSALRWGRTDRAAS